MTKRTLPHRDETNIYVSEGGYVVIEQFDSSGHNETSRVALPYQDIPGVIAALQDAAKEAEENDR